MKENFFTTSLATVAIAILLTSTVKADVRINLTAGQLLQRDGITPMPDGGLLLVVASTTDASFAPPTATSFVPGADDQIVSRFTLNSASVGVAGDTLQSFAYTYSGTLSPGDPLLLYWYPTLDASSTAPGANTSYGMFRTDLLQDGSTTNWTSPADGFSYTLRFLTASQGGSNPNSAGIASFLTPVPEPSTYALLGFGLGGLTFGIAQRRRQTSGAQMVG